MSAHTQGPWSCLPEEIGKDYIRIRGTRLGGRYKVANVQASIYKGVHEHEILETRANARLIAAAPDLLAALKDLADDISERFDMECSSTNPGMVQAARNARAAIAKATGGAA